jgi:hypothetical protein
MMASMCQSGGGLLPVATMCENRGQSIGRYMPNKPRWLLRLPEITDQLATLSVPTVDRTMVQSIFQLKRRQAIELMHQLGSYRACRGFYLDRIPLLQELEALQNSPQFRWEQLRQQLTKRKIDQMEPTNRAAHIRLRPGRLEVDFHGSEDLLLCLQELSDMIANDNQRFQSLMEER